MVPLSVGAVLRGRDATKSALEKSCRALPRLSEQDTSQPPPSEPTFFFHAVTGRAKSLFGLRRQIPLCLRLSPSARRRQPRALNSKICAFHGFFTRSNSAK